MNVTENAPFTHGHVRAISGGCKHFEYELISALPLGTHNAVEMLHDCALYKYMIDINIKGVFSSGYLSGLVRSIVDLCVSHCYLIHTS